MRSALPREGPFVSLPTNLITAMPDFPLSPQSSSLNRFLLPSVIVAALAIGWGVGRSGGAAEGASPAAIDVERLLSEAGSVSERQSAILADLQVTTQAAADLDRTLGGLSELLFLSKGKGLSLEAADLATLFVGIEKRLSAGEKVNVGDMVNSCG